MVRKEKAPPTSSSSPSTLTPPATAPAGTPPPAGAATPAKGKQNQTESQTAFIKLQSKSSRTR